MADLAEAVIEETDRPNDGGPAFPGIIKIRADGSVRTSKGMSLRDWLAGHALEGIIASLSAVSPGDRERDGRHYAQVAVMLADHMLKELGHDA